MTDQYEFTEEENAVIGQCGTYASGWGNLCLIASATMLAVAPLCLTPLLPPVLAIALVPVGGLFCVLGVALRSVAKSLRAIVATNGNDIQLMMRALARLSSAFRLQLILTAAMIALIVVGGTALTLGKRFLPKSVPIPSSFHNQDRGGRSL